MEASKSKDYSTLNGKPTKSQEAQLVQKLYFLPFAVLLTFIFLCGSLYTFTENSFLPAENGVDPALFNVPATFFRWVGAEDEDDDFDEDEEDLMPMTLSGGMGSQGENFFDITVGNGSKDTIPISRTYATPYDEIKSDGTKYFMYSPSGGFNNQRKEMEYALEISRVINRTLLVPMAAKHTTWWSKYHYLGYEGLVPMDLLLDFNELAKYGPDIVPLNTTIFDLEKRLQKQPGMLYVKHPKHRVNWRGKEVVTNLGDPSITETVLFMKGPSMYHAWFNKPTMWKVREHVIYSKYIRRLAIEFMKRLGPHYNAIHMRLGDYYRHGRFPNPRSFVNQLLKEGFDPEHTLYIATEPKRPHGFFNHFERTFKVKYASDFTDIVDSFRGNFRPDTVNDVLGLIEQLVCTASVKFRGTGYSNFSALITYFRKNRDLHFPEVSAFREQFMIRESQVN